MVKKIFRKNRKGLGFFILLDLWSIIAIVAFLVLLLIYINFADKIKQRDIGRKIIGSNYPHYIISSFENEIVDFSTCVGAPENITRNEFLIWLDYNKEELVSSRGFGNCKMAFRNSLLKDYTTFLREDFAGDYDFGVILQGKNLVDACNSDIGEFESVFKYEIPAKNKNIEIIVCFTSEDKNDFKK